MTFKGITSVNHAEKHFLKSLSFQQQILYRMVVIKEQVRIFLKLMSDVPTVHRDNMELHQSGRVSV